MRKCVCSFLVLLVMVLGVQTAVFAEPDVKMVPFTARYTSGPVDVTSYSLDACTEKGWGTSYFDISGNVTHMGKMEGTLLHCFNDDTYAFENGLFTMTGANGDSIYGEYTGQILGDYFTVEYTIIGGTGRFENAIGSGSGVGVFSDMTTFEFDAELNGDISSVGSSK